MDQLPALHFAIDEVPICGAIVGDRHEQTTHLTAVTCKTCLDALRALKPPVHGLPLDVEHYGVLSVHHSRLSIETACLAVEHKWVFVGKQRWRCRVEDSDGHPFGVHSLFVAAGIRLPEILSQHLYYMDQRTSWRADIVTGRTRTGTAPRCVDLVGISPTGKEVTVRSFIGDSDPMTDEVHLSNKIGEYARHMLG